MAKDHPNDSKKTPAEVEARIWELAKKIDICMFTTWNGERQNSRPLSARVARDEHAIYFLVDVEGEKNGELNEYPQVSCAWADNSGYNYVVMTGAASVSDNRAKIKELFTDFDKAWWENAEDPTIRLITFVPERGELWDGPGRVVGFAKMVYAAITGAAPRMGDNASVRL